eukprot:2788678-Ditylum_brightwellii.AAC.1
MPLPHEHATCLDNYKKSVAKRNKKQGKKKAEKQGQSDDSSGGNTAKGHEGNFVHQLQPDRQSSSANDRRVQLKKLGGQNAEKTML